ncbi:hypothetical protein BPAE_0067g00040 [Botrytis paeoniae]|uniref:DUF7587 domain-containing protein n=1 Tax=Botrytis paeoniae TaxID=278948 RepID=A0A4Z1FSW6_9HELO|nr:hypothetical protein BPAE_0067g00040 [Botrytis paeoniae]
MSSQLFYRVYSPKSAGGLICGKANQGWHRPSHINLKREFENHKDLSNREPTALVSVTSSIIRVLKIAFNKRYKDREDRSDIWIAFIKVPDRDKDVYHSAQEMAEKCDEEIPVLFKDEYLFEWKIPMEYVVHRVSVQTLVDRGLNMKEYRENTWIKDQHRRRKLLPSTSVLRTKIANAVCDFTFVRKAQVYNSHDMFESAVQLAGMVRAFGAEALGLDLLWEIFSDCCTGRFSSPRYFKQCYNSIQEDCNAVLLDWWLLGDKFNCDYECHLEYAAHLREIMTSQWVELSGKMICISEDCACYEKEFGILMKREEDMEEEIEADATRYFMSSSVCVQVNSLTSISGPSLNAWMASQILAGYVIVKFYKLSPFYFFAHSLSYKAT